MDALNNLKTSVKLIGSFIIIAILTAIVGGAGILYIRQIDAADTVLYQNQTVPISQLAEIAVAFQRTRVNLRDMLLATTPQESQSYANTIKTLSADIDKFSAEYAKLILSPEMQALYNTFDKSYKSFIPDRDQIMALATANNTTAALALMRGDGLVTAKAVEANIDAMVAMKVEQAKTTSDNNFATANQASTIMLIFVVFAVLLAIAFGAVIANSIANPLGIVTRMAQALATGDLLRDMSATEKDRVRKRQDEIGTIGKAFDGLIAYLQTMADAMTALADNDLTVNVRPNSPKDELGVASEKMITGLREMIGQVTDSAANLSSASEQLASAANQAGQATSQISATIQQIAKGITQESQSVTRTASSVEQMSRAIDGVAKGAQEQTSSVSKAAEMTGEISKTIQQVAGNVQSVTRDSANAAEAARVGTQTVTDTVQGMERIKSKVSISSQRMTEMGARSEQIGSIVETIEDIASQTNLLALNAAIEAARAGEHGKGFAVVADEVRKLAERSSGATKEIGGLIKGIQKTVAEAVKAMDEGVLEVENGVKLANESGDALSEILKAAEAVYKQAEEAAKGAAIMGAAAGQLVSAVDGVSAVVEENTAATEEMAAGTSEVTRAIENIASVSEENSAAVEEVSASTEEMSAQVEEVTASAQSLSDMAGALQEMVALFKLTDDRQAGSRGAKVALKAAPKAAGRPIRR